MTEQIMDTPEREVVPEEWKRIGFSGFFTLRAKCNPDDWKDRHLPCFIEGNALVLLRIDGDEAVIIRRDDNAIVDCFTTRGKRLYGGKS